MKKTGSQLRAVLKSKNIKEVFGNISWEMVEILAFMPLLLFTVSPLYQFVSRILNNRAGTLGSSYPETLGFVSVIAAVAGAIVILVCTGKHCMAKKRITCLLTESMPVLFFILFVILMIVSTCINGFTELALSGSQYRHESLFTYIMYFMVYFICAACIKNEKYKELIIYTYIIISVIMAAAAMIALWVHPISFFIKNNHLASCFHQFNHYGYFILMSILLSAVLFIRDKRVPARILCGVSFVSNTIVLIINDTFGCYLACLFGLIFCCIVLSCCDNRFNMRAITIFASFIAISLVMSIWYESVINNIVVFIKDIISVFSNSKKSKAAGTGRWDLWINTIKYIKEKPIFGFGVEGIAERLYLDTDKLNDRTHNEFLQYAAFFGIPAVIMYICGVFCVFLNGLKNRLTLSIYSQAALVCAFGYLVSSVFGNTMYYTAPFLFIFLGMGVTGDRVNK